LSSLSLTSHQSAIISVLILGKDESGTPGEITLKKLIWKSGLRQSEAKSAIRSLLFGQIVEHRTVRLPEKSIKVFRLRYRSLRNRMEGRFNG